MPNQKNAIQVDGPAPARKHRRVGPHSVKMTEFHRQKIINAGILAMLISHVQGKRKMSTSQVTAALGLLRKVMPDLSSATFSSIFPAEQDKVTRIEIVARDKPFKLIEHDG